MKRTLLAVLATVTTGCGATVADLPLPSPGTDGETYTIEAVFADALNLPESAHVKLGGSDIGVVTAIEPGNFTANVRMEITESVVLHEGTRAELRQATPLGDVFVAITLPSNADAGRVLGDGDILDLEHTAAGASVEDLLVSVSLLLNGGGINQLARISSEMSSILDGRGEQLGHLMVTMTGVIGSLNSRTEQIDRTLAGLDALLGDMNSRSADLGRAADSLPPLITLIAENNTDITNLIDKVSVTMSALGDFTDTAGPQSLHLFGSVQDLMAGFARMGDDLAGTLDGLHTLYPSVQQSFEGSTLAVAATVSYLSVGALTDPGGSRLPDGTDIPASVGSLSDVLARVIDRLQGGRLMVRAVLRFLTRYKIALGNLGLAAVFLLGAGYLAVAIMRVNPLHATFAVEITMPSSGGLLPDADVTFRGQRVGTVRTVDLAGEGVRVVVDIDSGVRISADTAVAVNRLSAAGEQYVDFRPVADREPYLVDGAEIDSTRVTLPVTIESVLANTSGLIDGLNPERLDVIVDELDKALEGGPDRLRNAIAGLSIATAGMTSLLPQTTSLVANLSTILDTTSGVQPDLGTLTAGAGVLFEQMTAADAEVRRLLELGPGQLATLGGVVAETSDPVTNLVTNFVAVTKAAKLRTPAIAALFPSLRTGSAALGVPAHDGAFHTLVDIWPRPTCEYDTIPVAPNVVGDGRVRLYNYCVSSDPALQIRGSANAPRPAVPDNGSGPPPGVVGDELSTPLSPR